MTSSSSSVQEALNKAKALFSGKGPASTPQAASRRKLQEHLISLCSYPSYECKAYFGTFVAKHFAEFEDLQDKAVDAILDLCEDDEERVRMIGIKGLGATAKADSRWVRGNTGVLLQLLECPPKELKLVHEALCLLLSVSASDVFAVMADDCRGSEEETGASRRNILDFLQKDAVNQRKDILESGNHQDVEATFRTGFEGVLETTAIAETRLVLGLLLPLSTISGKNATPESAGRFARTLAVSLRAGSSTPLTTPLIRLFAEFVKPNPPLEAPEALNFLAAHGAAVVLMALEKDDRAAILLIGGLTRWVDETVKLWKTKPGKGDLAENKLVPTVCSSLLSTLLDQLGRSSQVFSKSTNIVERLLFDIYRLITFRDGRRTYVKSAQSRALLDLARDASDAQKKPPSSSSRALDNIRLMAEILGDTHQSLEEVVPSWEPVPTPRSHPPNKMGSPTAVSKPIPPIGPRSLDRPSRPAPSIKPPPTASAFHRELLPGPSRSLEIRNNRVELMPERLSSTSHAGEELLFERPSIVEPSTQQDGQSRPGPSTSSPRLPIRPVASHQPTIASSTRSLAERLNMAPPPSTKRVREEPSAQSPSESRPSLLSRMSEKSGQSEHSREQKKPRSSLPESNGRPLARSSSLLSRMSSGDEDRMTNHSPLSTPRNTSAPTGFSSLPKPPLSSAGSSISVLGRATSQTTPATSLFSIRNHSKTTPLASASPSASPVQMTSPLKRKLSIRSASSGAEDDGIVRKGRGFSREENDEDILMAPTITPAVSGSGGAWRAGFGG